MILLGGAVALFLVVGAVALVVSRLGSDRSHHAVDRYDAAMQALRDLPDRVAPPGAGPAGADEAEEHPVASGIAGVMGVGEHDRRDPLVESNARITGTTGLLLIVLLFLEGLTIPFVGRLISWHIAIGLVLVPPILLKLTSVGWRFAHYYLRDPRYRQAGPPHPFLRVLGPLVVLSTLVVFASGIALWLAGHSSTLLILHRLSFIFWFAVTALHVLAHLLRAARLASADAQQARSRDTDRRARRGARGRRRVVLASLLLGILAGLGGHAVHTVWRSGVLVRPTAPSENLNASADQLRQLSHALGERS